MHKLEGMIYHASGRNIDLLLPEVMPRLKKDSSKPNLFATFVWPNLAEFVCHLCLVAGGYAQAQIITFRAQGQTCMIC